MATLNPELCAFTARGLQDQFGHQSFLSKMSSEVCLDMEIRKLRPGELYTLSNILSMSDSWKKLMAIVPKQENVPKFSSDHIRQARKYFSQ